MKTINIIIGICLSCSIAFANGGNAEKIFQELKKNNEVFSMSLSKDLTDFFDMDVDFDGKEKMVTGDFTKGAMLVVDNIGDGQEVKKLFMKYDYHWVQPEKEQQTDDDDEEAYLFVDRKGSQVSEAHLVVVGDEKTVVLTIYGDIKVTNKK